MEKILCYHPDESEYEKIRRIAGNLKIRCARISPQELNQTVGCLILGRPDPLTAPYSGNPPAESLLVLCGFTDKRLDRLLRALKSPKIKIDFKAVETPVNRNWSIRRLLLHMHAEQAFYQS